MSPGVRCTRGRSERGDAGRPRLLLVLPFQIVLQVRLLRIEAAGGTVLGVLSAEFLHRVRVALAAEVLERVRGGNGPQLRRFLERLAGRHALHQSTAERIADSGRVDDAMRRERLRVGSSESRIPSPGSRLLVSRISKL